MIIGKNIDNIMAMMKIKILYIVHCIYLLQ